MARVKVCGITRAEDGLLAAQLGAWAIGFIFAESPRKLSVNQAAQISKRLPQDVLKVGVFVNASTDEMKRVFEQCHLDLLQLHGQEDLVKCESLKKDGFPVIKAIAMKDELSLEHCKTYSEVADYLLLDTYHPEIPGGTGRTFHWDLAKQVKERILGPFLLSGGINEENVGEALSEIGPFALDFSSGVEEAAGIKSHSKLKRLFNLIR